MRHKCASPNCIRRRERHQQVEVLRSEADPASLGFTCLLDSCVRTVVEEDRKTHEAASHAAPLVLP